MVEIAPDRASSTETWGRSVLVLPGRNNGKYRSKPESFCPLSSSPRSQFALHRLVRAALTPPWGLKEGSLLVQRSGINGNGLQAPPERERGRPTALSLGLGPAIRSRMHPPV